MSGLPQAAGAGVVIFPLSGTFLWTRRFASLRSLCDWASPSISFRRFWRRLIAIGGLFNCHCETIWIAGGAQNFWRVALKSCKLPATLRAFSATESRVSGQYISLDAGIRCGVFHRRLHQSTYNANYFQCKLLTINDLAPRHGFERAAVHHHLETFVSESSPNGKPSAPVPSSPTGTSMSSTQTRGRDDGSRCRINDSAFSVHRIEGTSMPNPFCRIATGLLFARFTFATALGP